jgi:hypothetical protein
MEWLVSLEGDAWNLEDLPQWFSQLAHKVRLEDGRYYLTSAASEHCTTSASVWETADQIVAWINGVVKALDPRFRPVQVGSEIRQVHDDGTQQVHFRAVVGMGEVRAEAGAVIVSVGGKPVPPQPSKAEKLVAMLEKVGPMSAVPRALDAWLLPTTWQRLCE